MKSLSSILLVVLAGQSSLASSSSFGSGCTSQGQWTSAALGGIDQLRQTVQKLAADPNCKNLSVALQNSIEASKTALTSISQNNPGTDTTSFMNIPRELGALKNYYSSSRIGDQSDRSILDMMASMAVNHASQMSKNSSSPEDGSGQMSSPLKTLSQRIQSATDTSLISMMSFIDELPKNQTCVYGNTGGAAMLGGVVNVMAAFASAGQNTIGPKMADSINKLAMYMRDMKLSSADTIVNTAEFQNSMACLLESTSEAYCSARDAGFSLRRGSQLLVEQQLNDKSSLQDVSNPLNGYFILTQSLPVVTDWLQKVQVGVQPRTIQDANFKKIIMGNVQMFFNSVFDLQGNLSEKAKTIREYPSLDAKANAIVAMILQLSAEMGGGSQASMANFGGSAGMVNFFTQGRQTMKIPFEIAGLDDNLPEIVFSNDPKVMRMDPDSWFNNPMGLDRIKAKMGSNPDGYLEEIRQNVDKIVKDSTRNAIAYYGTWFIVDEGHLVSESLTGMNYTVKDSLVAIYSYLAGFAKRGQSDSQLGPLLANVYDTMRRLQKILVEYDKARIFFDKEVAPFMNALEKENKKQYQIDKGYYSFVGGVRKSCAGKSDDCKLEDQLSDKKMAALFERVSDYNTSIISTLYDELNVLLSRSSFLANRVSVFVEADFYNQLKTNKNISQFEKDFYIATGLSAYQGVLSMFQNNPEAARMDIAQALVLHKSTLEALEMLFKNSMAQHIERLRLNSENESATPNAIGLNSIQRLAYDSDPSSIRANEPEAVQRLHAKEQTSLDFVSQTWRAIETTVVAGYKKLSQSSRYEMPFELPIHERVTSPTDEFNSHRDIYQKLCIQALAFNDLTVFAKNCGDVVLKSIINPATKDSLSPQVKRFLDKSSVSWMEKQLEGSERITDRKKFESYNHSVRICAYRDFLRNSRVAYLTSAQNVVRYDKSNSGRVDQMIQKIIDHDLEVEKEENERRIQLEEDARRRVEQQAAQSARVPTSPAGAATGDAELDQILGSLRKGENK